MRMLFAACFIVGATVRGMNASFSSISYLQAQQIDGNFNRFAQDFTPLLPFGINAQPCRCSTQWTQCMEQAILLHSLKKHLKAFL